MQSVPILQYAQRFYCASKAPKASKAPIPTTSMPNPTHDAAPVAAAVPVALAVRVPVPEAAGLLLVTSPEAVREGLDAPPYVLLPVTAAVFVALFVPEDVAVPVADSEAEDVVLLESVTISPLVLQMSMK